MRVRVSARDICTALRVWRCVCVRLCVRAWGYAGWSCGPVRQGQMVPGGWLSSWWPSWWCCLWSLLIRYASLPESPAPSRCLSYCFSHRSQFMSMCLPLTPLCISNAHTTPFLLCVCAPPCPSLPHTHTQTHTSYLSNSIPKLPGPQNTGQKRTYKLSLPTRSALI